MYLVILTLTIRSGMVMLTICEKVMLDLQHFLAPVLGRANVIARNPEKCSVQTVITAPFLDEVNAHIDTRFSDLQKKAIQVSPSFHQY